MQFFNIMLGIGDRACHVLNELLKVAVDNTAQWRLHDFSSCLENGNSSAADNHTEFVITVRLQCLRRDSVTLISTLLVTYMYICLSPAVILSIQ